MFFVQFARLRLRHFAMACGYDRRPQALTAKHIRVIEVEQSAIVAEFQLRDCEWQATAAKQGGRDSLSSKARQLLDNTGDSAIGKIETAVEIRVVVAAFSLKHARKPQRAVRLAFSGAFVPGEAPVKNHANVSARSARIARISSSVRPARMRSMGRRSPSKGFTPKSHARAASRS